MHTHCKKILLFLGYVHAQQEEKLCQPSQFVIQK